LAGDWPVICNNDYESGSAKCLEFDVSGERMGTWTPSFKEAQDFGGLQPAIEFACHHELFDAQIVIVMERETGVQFIPYQIQAMVQEANPSGASRRPVL